MRDYALNRAMAAESIGASLLNLHRNWRARHRIEKLADSGDAILQDFGITRHDVQWAMRLPLGRNPMLALEDRAFRQSRTQPASARKLFVADTNGCLWVQGRQW